MIPVSKYALAWSVTDCSGEALAEWHCSCAKADGDRGLMERSSLYGTATSGPSNFVLCEDAHTPVMPDGHAACRCQGSFCWNFLLAHCAFCLPACLLRDLSTSCPPSAVLQPLFF